MTATADDLRFLALRLPPAAVGELVGATPPEPTLAQLRAAALLRTLDVPCDAIRALVARAAGADTPQTWAGLPPETERRVRTIDAVHRLLHPTAFECAVGRIPPRHVVGMSVRAALTEADARAAEARTELLAFVRLHDLTLAGPYSVTFRRARGDRVDLECSLPVEELTGSSGRVRPGFDGGGVVGTVVHGGDVRALPAAYDALLEWVAAQGHRVTGPPRELHDPARDRVQVCLPLG